MPLFDYVCEECDHAFEALVSEDRKPSCPNCQSGRLARQLSRFAVAGAPSASEGAACGACGDPRGAGACRMG